MGDWWQTFEHAKQIANPTERQQFLNWLIVGLIADMVYYIALATVAIVLGWRLINAIRALFREGRLRKGG